MKARRIGKLDPERSLAENAARMARVRLDELRSFAPAALDPRRSREQHDMRIAAKRLRYVLELTESCFGEAGPKARRRARDLQDLLGEIHDCDVMLPRVQAHLADLRSRDADELRSRAAGASDLDPRLAAQAPGRTAYRGLEVLAVHLEARRETLFERFERFWNEQERKGTWDALERATERTLREAKRRRREPAGAATEAPRS